MRIVLDFDDVLAPSNEMALELLNIQSGANYKLADIHGWGILGSPIDERLKLFRDPDFINSLPVYTKAKKFINSLMEVAEIVIATAVFPECASARFEVIRKEFPEISPNNIHIGTNKNYIQGDFMLDDGVHNLKKAAVNTPVLFRQPWNKKETGYVSVSNYDEFLDLVRRNKNE